MKYMIGVFNDEFDLLKAFDQVRAKGGRIEEVFTPYPVHDIIVRMGRRPVSVTRLFFTAFSE